MRNNPGLGIMTGVINRKALMMGVYVVLLCGAVLMSKVVPGGFVPAQDKEYLISFAQLPNGASLDRTEAVIRQMTDITRKTPGVQSAVEFPGLSVNGFTNSSSGGILFVQLKPFGERKGAALSAGAIAGSLNQKYAAIKGSFIAVFPPPPVLGLGTLGGFKLQLEDRAHWVTPH
jgi:multidrug efflux pump